MENLIIDIIRGKLLNGDARIKDTRKSSSNEAPVTEKNERKGCNQNRDHPIYDKYDAFRGRFKSRGRNPI